MPDHHKESVIDKWFVQKLGKLGVLTIKLSFASYLGSAGWPDRLVIVPGNKERQAGVEFYFVELKTVKGKLTARQKLRHEQLKHCLCNVCTLYGMEEVQRWTAALQEFHHLGEQPPTSEDTSS